MKNWAFLIVGPVLFVSPLCLAERPDDSPRVKSRIGAYCEDLLRGTATPDGAYDDGSSEDELPLEFGSEADAYDSGQF